MPGGSAVRRQPRKDKARRPGRAFHFCCEDAAGSGRGTGIVANDDVDVAGIDLVAIRVDKRRVAVCRIQQIAGGQVGLALDQADHLTIHQDLGIAANGLQRHAVGVLVDPEPQAVSRRIEIGDVTGRTVKIDRDQVSRAVSNLISNAVHHTSAGGVIEVSALDLGDSVSIIVDDNGSGVPEADRARIFDRFARLDQARTSTDGGSGLGLAIVKAIAEAHGGGVRCVDSPLGGARFVIDLPV